MWKGEYCGQQNTSREKEGQEDERISWRQEDQSKQKDV